MALYTRNELNIRTTANFLLAYASNHKLCRPFLKKFFKASIRLPSDWIDVAEQYQVNTEKNSKENTDSEAFRCIIQQDLYMIVLFLLKAFRAPGKRDEVLEAALTFHDPYFNYGSLPAALRRVMVAKFPDFDKYQLGKACTQ